LNLTLDLLPLWLLRAFAGAFGLLWGSFLNVVIYRLPRGMSVVHPPSHCPACGAPIEARNNVPVVSWLLLRGRASCCGAKVSARYPAVELIGGVLSLAVLELVVFSLPHASTTLGHAAAVHAAGFALALALVATAFIDLEHLLILPDMANASLALLGVATASFRGLDYRASFVGALVGFGVVSGIDRAYRALRGRSGMASGDAVLLGVLGAWFGWQGALFAIMAGAVQGTIALVVVRAFGLSFGEPESVKAERAAILAEIEALPEAEREAAMAAWREEDELADAPGEGGQAVLAFGPFLALAGLELLLFYGPLSDAVFLWQLG